MKNRILLILIAVLSADVVFSEGLDEGRKELQGLFITERASSQQDKGEWQVRGDFEYRRGEEEREEEEEGEEKKDLTQYRIPLSLEYGIFDWLELGLDIPAYVWQELENEETGSVGNLSASLSFLVLRGDSQAPYISIGVGGGFPTADEGEGIVDEEEEYSYEGFINLTKYFLIWVLDINLAFGQSRNGETEEELEYNIGADFLLDQIFQSGHLIGWHFTAEFNGESALGEDENAFYLTPGVKYVTSRGWELGIGSPIGLVDEADSYRIIASVTYEWGGE